MADPSVEYLNANLACLGRVHLDILNDEVLLGIPDDSSLAGDCLYGGLYQ